jgi:hypothetical protein
MIEEPKMLVRIKRPSITPIEIPRHASDRFLHTIANKINGMSSRQQASRAGIRTLFRSRIRYSVSDPMFHSRFVLATNSRAMVALAFSDFRILIRSMHTLTPAATPLVLITRIMLPISTASGQKWGHISMRLTNAPNKRVTMETIALGTYATFFVETPSILLFARNVKRTVNVTMKTLAL